METRLGKVEWSRTLWTEEGSGARLGKAKDKDNLVLQVGDRHIYLWDSEVAGLAHALVEYCKEQELDIERQGYLPF